MRVYWERVGVLGPIYRLVRIVLSNTGIANRLNLTEPTVRNCASWMLRFLKLDSRAELVLYALTPASQR